MRQGISPEVKVVSFSEYRRMFPQDRAWWWRIRNRPTRCRSRAVKTWLKHNRFTGIENSECAWQITLLRDNAAGRESGKGETK